MMSQLIDSRQKKSKKKKKKIMMMMKKMMEVRSDERRQSVSRRHVDVGVSLASNQIRTRRRTTTTTTTTFTGSKFKMKPPNRMKQTVSLSILTFKLLSLLLLAQSIYVVSVGGHLQHLDWRPARPSNKTATSFTTTQGNRNDLLAVGRPLRAPDGEVRTAAISSEPRETSEWAAGDEVQRLKLLQQQLVYSANERQQKEGTSKTSNRKRETDADERDNEDSTDDENSKLVLSTNNFQAANPHPPEQWKRCRRKRDLQEEAPEGSGVPKRVARSERPPPTSPRPATGRKTPEQAAKTKAVILGLLGGQTTLDCNLQPDEPDDAVSLVLWYKDNSMVPIYSVDARAAPVHLARHKPGAWLEGRSSLRIVPPVSGPQTRLRRRTHDDEEDDDHEEDADADAEGTNKTYWPHFGGNKSGLRVHVGRPRRRRWLQEDLLEPKRHSRRQHPRRQRHSSLVQAVGSGPQQEEEEEEEDDVDGNNVMEDEPVSSGESLPMAEARTSTGQSDEAGQAAKESSKLVAQLKIDSLSSEDNGIYRCRVDFRRARSRIEERELRIIVPAERPIIRDLTGQPPGTPTERHQQPGRPQSGLLLVGPHPEGARVVLECETSGGYPEPVLSWWRDGQLVDDTYELVEAADGRLLERKVGGPWRAEEQPDNDGDGGGQSGEQPHHRPHLYHHLHHHHHHRPDKAPNTDADDGTGQVGTDGEAEPAEGPPTTRNRLIRNRLELEPLSRADLMANYSCRAWNSRLGEPPASSAMIDMNLRPLKVQIDNERQPILADKQVELVCRAFGARPSALISWFKGSARLRPTPAGEPDELAGGSSSRAMANKQSNGIQIQETISADSNVTTSTLSFTPQLDDSAQIITCKAETAGTSAAAAPTSHLQPIEDSWRLEVHHLPRVSLALGDKLNGRQVREGHDVYFECSARAQPVAHELRWWFDGKELETNISVGVIVSNQSLVLQRVSRKQAGRYTCSAINSVGEAHSNPVHLFVQHAPYCRDRRDGDLPLPLPPPLQSEGGKVNKQFAMKTHYGVARMESVKVYCHVEANPSDSMSYKWAFVSNNNQQQQQQQQPQEHQQANQKLVNSSQEPLTYLDASLVEPVDRANPLVSVATWTPRSELDYGTLLCWAQNALGRQSEPCAYRLVAAERPEPVRNCRLLNASDSQLAVACRPGYDGGVDQTFHMEVYLANGSSRAGASRELVANVSSAGPSTGLWAPTPSNDVLKNGDDDEHPSNNDIPSNHLEDGTQDDQSSGGHQQQPASLISSESNSTSSTTVSRLQKQRHSSQDQNQPEGGRYRQANSNEEAIFLTDPHMLAPATDYLLSIYSSNSKGSSKPVAFTATTTNSSLSSLALGGRDGRRADSMINEVFSLSWSPFLLVCAVTVVIFALFGSITFALMKYVDLTGLLVNDADHHSGELSLSRKKPNHVNSNTSANNYVSGSTYAPSSSICSDQTGGNHQQQQRHLQDVECSLSIDGDNSATGGGRRARIIALGCESNELEIPLNEMHQPDSTARNSSSVMDGAYLRFKLQQPPAMVANSSCNLPLEGPRLKQSNSDNYLNQNSAMHELDSSETDPNNNNNNNNLQHQPLRGSSNWFHSRSPHYQAAYCGGTLPRNLIGGHQQARLTLGAHQPAPVYLEQHGGSSNPYGYLSLLNQVNGVQSSMAATTSSGQTPEGAAAAANSSHLTSLMLAPAASSGMATLPASQQQHQQQQQPQIEHLVISGKQYIHQIRPATTTTTTTTTSMLASTGNKINSTAAAADLAIQRHLQLTSGHNNIDMKETTPLAGSSAASSSASSTSACSAPSTSSAPNRGGHQLFGGPNYSQLRQQTGSPVDCNYPYDGCTGGHCGQQAVDLLLNNNNNYATYMPALIENDQTNGNQNNNNSGTQPSSLTLTGEAGSPSSGLGGDIFDGHQSNLQQVNYVHVNGQTRPTEGSTSTLTSGNETQSDEQPNGANQRVVCQGHLPDVANSNGDRQMEAPGKSLKALGNGVAAGGGRQQRPKKGNNNHQQPMDNYTILVDEQLNGGQRADAGFFVLPDNQMLCSGASLAVGGGGGHLRSANRTRVRLVSTAGPNELLVVAGADQYGLIQQAAAELPHDANNNNNSHHHHNATAKEASQAAIQDLQTQV